MGREKDMNKLKFTITKNPPPLLISRGTPFFKGGISNDCTVVKSSFFVKTFFLNYPASQMEDPPLKKGVS